MARWLLGLLRRLPPGSRLKQRLHQPVPVGAAAVAVLLTALLAALLPDGRAAAETPELVVTRSEIRLNVASAPEGSQIIFTVRINPVRKQPTPFKWKIDTGAAQATASNADFTATSGSAALPANAGVYKLYIPLAEDQEYEGDERFAVTLFDLPADTLFVTDWKSHHGIIRDNDPNPMLKVKQVMSYHQLTPLPPQATHQLTVSAAPDYGRKDPISVTFNNPRPDLLTISPSTITLPGCCGWVWGNGAELTLKSKGNLSQGVVFVKLGVSLTYQGKSIAGDSITVAVNHGWFVDNEISPQLATLTEGAKSFRYGIRLKRNPVGIVRYDAVIQQQLRVMAGETNLPDRVRITTDLEKNPIVFRPSNWNQWQYINIDIVEDDDSADENLIILHPRSIYRQLGLRPWNPNLIRLFIRDNDSEPPTRVGKATLSGLTSTAVNIGWNSAGDVAGYQIRYWETDDGEVKKRKIKLDGKVLTLSNSKFLYRLADLEAGRSYRLRVHVVLKNGKVDNKLSSGVLRFTTPDAPKQQAEAQQQQPEPTETTPAATSAREPVGQPSATSKSHEEISVSWPAVQGVSEYEVRYWETANKQETKVKLRSNTPSITLTKLKPSTDYTIRAFFIKNGKVHNSKASPPLRVVTDAAP